MAGISVVTFGAGKVTTAALRAARTARNAARTGETTEHLITAGDDVARGAAKARPAATGTGALPLPGSLWAGGAQNFLPEGFHFLNDVANTGADLSNGTALIATANIVADSTNKIITLASSPIPFTK